MSTASALPVPSRGRRRRSGATIIAVVAVGLALGMVVGVHQRGGGHHTASGLSAAARASGIAPADARGGQADAIGAGLAGAANGSAGVAPAAARGGEAEAIAAGSAAASEAGSVAPADASGGVADAIAAGHASTTARQDDAMSADSSGSQTDAIDAGQAAAQPASQGTSAAPLTVYVVATSADQDRVNAEIVNDASFVDAPNFRTPDAVAVAIAPDDALAVQALPGQFPNRQVTVVDLRGQ